MADVNVPHGASMKVGRVEGDIHVASRATMHAAAGNLILVTGQARFAGDARVECDLECESLTVERSGELVVAGNLTVHRKLDVSNSIGVAGTMKAADIDVGGRVSARSLSCKRMRVGGTAEVSESLQAESIEVGGKIEARGTLDLRDLQVGGKAEVGGGAITGTINIGGKFASSAKLDFGELRVYGISSLAAGSKGKRIVSSGKLEAKGDLQCDLIEISGVARVSGACRAIRVDVKGKLVVEESLSVSENLDAAGATDIKDTFTGKSLRIGGRFTAGKALVTEDAEIYGGIETKKGLKARTVLVGSGTRCSGPIVAETVEVGGSGRSLNAFFWGQRLRVQVRTSQVEDIYASKVVVGPGSRARRIFAESIELGSGCDVEEVTYVTELKDGRPRQDLAPREQS